MKSRNMPLKPSQSQPDMPGCALSRGKKRVCMFVYNNFTNDSRVQKEAEALIQENFDVTVMALLDQQTEPVEDRNGIRIERVKPDPWHLRFLSLLNSPGQFCTKVEVKEQAAVGNGIVSYAGKALLKLLKLFVSSLFSLARVPKGLFKYLFATIFYCLVAIGSVRLLYSPDFYALIAEHEIYIYFTLIVLILLRNYIYHGYRRGKRSLVNTLKNCLMPFHRGYRRGKRSLVNTLKNCLMPFHRHFCFLSFYRKAYPATAGQNFDIYHAHDLNTLPVAWRAARRDRAKLVYDSHELYIDRNKLNPSNRLWKFIQRRIEGFLVRRCDAVFTVNESIAKELGSRYRISTPSVVMNTPARFEKADLHLLGNGMLRKEASVSPEQKLLLYVGGITFNRGLEELIQSLVHLPDCYLIYMGYGSAPYKKSLMDLAEELGVRDRFSFFGPVPSHRVIHYAAGADLGVAPIANACLSYYYCSPNKLFEYMNAGLPVIASNFPELEKVVLGHEIGLTFDPADPQDIAGTARKILDNQERASQMRQNALKASGQYNWGNEAKELLQIYSSLYESA